MLARFFQERGHHVTVLTRGPYTAPWQTVHWDGQSLGPWVETLEGADVCIHLSGRSVNCRYTARNRRQLYDSRIGPTRLLHQAFACLVNPPRLWMNASTATIYRHSLDEAMDETTARSAATSPSRSAAAHRKNGTGPCSWLRTGSLRSSAQQRRARARSLCARRWFSALRPAVYSRSYPISSAPAWAARRATAARWFPGCTSPTTREPSNFLIEHEDIDGPVNLCAPDPLPNREFMAELREAWDVPNGLPAPAALLAIGMFFLRTEPELVLKSRYVIPGRLLDAGFQFEFPTWPEAAADLVRQWRQRDE